MAAMRALAWDSERGSARPRGGRVSVSARKRSRRSACKSSSSRGRGAGAGTESTVLLRDLCQPVSRNAGGAFHVPTCTASRGRGGMVVWLRHGRADRGVRLDAVWEAALRYA